MLLGFGLDEPAYELQRVLSGRVLSDGSVSHANCNFLRPHAGRKGLVCRGV